MIRRSFFAVAATVLLLGACALPDPDEVGQVNAVRKLVPSGGTPFTQALTAEYKAYAIHEADKEFEWDHAAIFARKALEAAKGTVVQVTEPNKEWMVPANRQAELNEARAKLVGHFNTGARERVPADAAHAQVMYECWIEEEAEGDTNSDCRAEFLKTEPKLAARPVAASAPAPAPAPAPKIVKTFIVYFDFNKADITAQAMKTLKEVTDAQAQLKPANIYLSGHTDTVGNSSFNQKLSERRVQAVATQLAKMGVAAKALDTKAFGKNKLQVQTPDNTKEGKNRRVEIYFEK